MTAVRSMLVVAAVEFAAVVVDVDDTIGTAIAVDTTAPFQHYIPNPNVESLYTVVVLVVVVVVRTTNIPDVTVMEMRGWKIP